MECGDGVAEGPNPPGVGLSELLLQPPGALLPCGPVEVADAPQQLPEDGRLLLAQPGPEVPQQLLGGGLPVHAGLEGHEVAEVGQQFVVVGGRSRRGCRELLLLLFPVSLAGRRAEVVADPHLGQQGGGGELGALRLALWSLPAEMSAATRLLRQRFLYDCRILKEGETYGYPGDGSQRPGAAIGTQTLPCICST